MSISEMDVKDWVITIISVGGLLFAGVWLLLHYFWLGRRYRWPGLEGSRRTSGYEGYEVHVLTSAGAPSIVLQGSCAKAVAATGHGWTLTGQTGPHKKIGEVAVWFRPDVEFDHEPREYLRKAAAYLDEVPRSVGGHMPLAVIRVSLISLVISEGEPVIHEMLHALDDRDPGHTDPEIWQATGKARSAQARAREVYARTIGIA